MTTTTKAQVFWDKQDPRNQGWWLRFYVDGQENGVDLPGSKNRKPQGLCKLALELCAAEKVTFYEPNIAAPVFERTREGEERWL